MDNWQVAQNYIVAAALAGTVGGYYYYTSNQKKHNRTGASLTPRRSETDLKSGRRATRERASSHIAPAPRSQDATKKSKPKHTAAAEQHKDVVTASGHDARPVKESDMSNAQFAQQLLQARQGANLSSSKAKETRIKTVKPKLSSALGSPAASVAGAEIEDDVSPAPTAATTSGDVSDMLEAKPNGPSSLRITASAQPQTQRAPRQAKEEIVESKKQRQNRKKVEERRVQREQEEQERKVLEERQRRTAREARGEPAKNGLAKPPIKSAWERGTANGSPSVQSTGSNIGGGTALLDTFDAESTSSSTGGLEASTAATSTTSEQHVDTLTEDEQVAAAIKQSGDESGWTTVAAPKRTKKQPSNSNMAPAREQTITKNEAHAKSGAYAALETHDSIEWEA